MGTSLRMIDEHYGHVIRELQSHLVTGGNDPMGSLRGALQQVVPDRHAEAQQDHDPEEWLLPEELGFTPIPPKS